MSGSRLLAIFAHPDDEAFACGGTLAAAAVRGVEVTVVCATRGERGTARDGGVHDRVAELEASCRALGVGPPVVLDLPDGDLAAHRAALAARVADLPAGVRITFGRDGAYGHADHVACSEAVTTGDGTSVLHVVFPDGLFDPIRRRLRRTPVPLVPPPPARPSAGYTVDIRRWASVKLQAIAAHASQLVDGDPRSFLAPGIVDALLDEERFRLAAGPPPSGPLAGLLEAAR